MLEWMRALKFRWVIGLALGWWAVMSVVVAVLVGLAPPAAPEPTYTADGGLNIIDVCGRPLTAAEWSVVVALAMPVAFGAAWVIARDRGE
jgi:hypothetical protein